MKRREYIIATHSLVYGAPQALCDYLNKTGDPSFFFISHSFDAGPDRLSQLVHYQDGQARTLTSRSTWFRKQLLKTMEEMLLTIIWVAGRIGKKTPPQGKKIFIGVNPINALCGVVLKKLGWVDMTVFYTIDYVPKRHPNPLVNRFYHQIDRWCYFGADAVWNVSARINEGRRTHGYASIDRPNVHIVPIGIWLLEKEPDIQRKNNQLVFIGHLLEKQGVQYILDAMPLIIKAIPDVKLLVIGGGEYESALKDRAAALGLGTAVTFTGWVKDRARAEAMLRESELALAPYDRKLDTFTYYADPTKLKDYLSCGLPIILTDVPHNAKEIEECGCGVIVDLRAESIADAVRTILSNRPRLERMREAARGYIGRFAWNAIFKDALEKLH